jgi:hypothetical protein
MTKKHVKNIYGDDGNVIFTQYRIDGVDYLENSDGAKIRLDKLRDAVEAFAMKGVHVVHPDQILEIVDMENKGTIATVSTSGLVFTPDGYPMTEVSILADGYGVNVLDIEDDEDDEEEEEKIPYDFKLVEHEDGKWLEWYDNDLIDHGFCAYDMALIVEELWRKKQAEKK